MCAALMDVLLCPQARLDALAPELEGLGDIEGRHAGLEVAQ